MDIAAQQMDIGRRAAQGERADALAVEAGVTMRTIARWRARWRASQGAPDAEVKDSPAAPPRTDTPRARARGPIARSIRQTATAILAIMEHDTAVIAAARAERPREVVLTDAEHARALSAMARTLRELLATAPELLTTAGESTPEAVAVAEETDPARRAELLRDYALARGQVPAAIAAETAARRAVDGDTLQVVITQEGADAIAREAGD